MAEVPTAATNEGAGSSPISLPAISRHVRAPRRWRGGPAWLVMIANVDAASILTALASGASFQYDLVWFLVALTVPLFFIQEAAGRIGAVSGKGLAELARARFSARIAASMTISMAIGDIAIYVAEYAGIALGLSLFGIPPIISLPLAFVAHIALVARGRYSWVEKVLIAVSVGVIVALLGVVLHQGLLPYSPIGISDSPAFFFLLAANVGAVVMPFMLFFQSSATAEKRTTVRISRQSTLIGAGVSEALMILVVVIGAGIGTALNIADNGAFAAALVAALGQNWTYVLGIGIVAAAFLALVVVSLGSAWGLVEALGLPKKSALWIYAIESIPAVFIPLFFPQLITLVLALMVAMVFILIVPAILLGKLVSDPTVMGEHASSGSWRFAYWASVLFVVAVGVVGVVVSI